MNSVCIHGNESKKQNVKWKEQAARNLKHIENYMCPLQDTDFFLGRKDGTRKGIEGWALGIPERCVH